MRQFRFLAAFFAVCLLAFVGCGGSEATTISGDELDQYVEANADEIAEQDKIDAMEEAEEEDEDDE